MSVFETPRKCASSFFPEKDALPPPRVTSVTRGENAVRIHIVGKPSLTIVSKGEGKLAVTYRHPFNSSIYHEMKRFTLMAKEFSNADFCMIYNYFHPDTGSCEFKSTILLERLENFLEKVKNEHWIVMPARTLKAIDRKPENDANKHGKVGLFPHRSCQTTSKSFDMGKTTEHADEKMGETVKVVDD